MGMEVGGGSITIGKLCILDPVWRRLSCLHLANGSVHCVRRVFFQHGQHRLAIPTSAPTCTFLLLRTPWAPFALCALRFALCALRSALCPLPFSSPYFLWQRRASSPLHLRPDTLEHAVVHPRLCLPAASPLLDLPRSLSRLCPSALLPSLLRHLLLPCHLHIFRRYQAVRQRLRYPSGHA